MPRRRLGVAIMVPDPLRREIDGLRRALGDASLGRVAPHLTLVSPVNVREDDLPAALAVLRRAAAAMQPFDVQLGPAASFHPVTPTVYLAVGGDVGAVHRLHEAVFTRPLVRPVDHAFVPHVTVAESLAVDRISAAVEALKGYLVEIAVDRLHLLQERRLDDGTRVWEPIADAMFGPVAVIGRGGLELEVTISDLVPPDVATRIEILDEGEPTPLDARPGRGLVVTGRRDGEVVGAATGWTLGRYGHLAVVAVRESLRGEGVGSHLVAAFESTCADRGCVELVGAAPDEPAILALLARRGWSRHLDRGVRDSPVVLHRVL